MIMFKEIRKGRVDRKKVCMMTLTLVLEDQYARKFAMPIFLYMANSFFICFLAFLIFITPFCVSNPLPYTKSIYPNFTASYSEFIDYKGGFLVSSNGTFKASISNPKSASVRFYFSIIHAPTNSIIWKANPDNPISDYDNLVLTIHGLAIVSVNGATIWSTPPLPSGSLVKSLQLQDSGNLVLLDGNDVSIWETFKYPTDTIVAGQRLDVGTSLNCVSLCDYQLTVTEDDLVLKWKGMSYWKLSMETNSFKNSNSPVSFLFLNSTGLFLIASDESTVVIQLNLGKSDFRIAKLGFGGLFNISSFVNGVLVEEHRSPADNCNIPSICGKMGFCTARKCECLPHFQPPSDTCALSDTSLPLPYPCRGSELNSQVSFVNLGCGVDYFAIHFMAPVNLGISVSVCQDLCSRNCSCFGFFHSNSSGSCYLLENELGSFFPVSSITNDNLGYIKTIAVSSTRSNRNNNRKLRIAGLVLIPAGILLTVILVALGFICWKRKRMRLGHTFSSLSVFDIVTIPGLPRSFSYQELEVATTNFSTQIGRGGFGTVYKGTLPDKTVLAVKEINNLGVQGKTEFCTETAIIGSIHHINLVKLIGFCAQGRRWFLVYEYMSRGSLEHTLFGKGPVLEWRERYNIALGTARGLAYLHSYCKPKILHCDVKPENILLHANLQVKISDFGLSKLLCPEGFNRISTLRGTRGYIAPEWLAGYTISEKVDVYSYGMVLLEIVKGRRNFTFCGYNAGEGNGLNLASSGSESEIIFAPQIALKKFQQNRCLDLADPLLQGNVTSQEVKKLVQIALCCLHKEPKLRPSMAGVVGMLEGSMPLAEPRIEYLDFQRFFVGLHAEAAAEGSNVLDKTQSIMAVDQLSGPR